MASAICAMLLSAWAVEGRLETIPFAIFAEAALFSLWLGVKMYRSILEGEEEVPTGGVQPVAA